jgi:hypothetical protein
MGGRAGRGIVNERPVFAFTRSISQLLQDRIRRIRTSVSTTDTTIEPRHPNRFE